MNRNLSRLPAVAAAFLLMGEVASRAAYDVFLKIEGIPGESLERHHQGWIGLAGIQTAMATPAQSGGSMPRLVIRKDIDKSTPKLMEACARGTQVPEARLEFVVQLERSARYYEIVLQDVLVSSIHHSTADDVPAETVSFAFEKIQWTYTVLDETGLGRENLAGRWDVVRGEAEPEETPLLRAGATRSPDGDLRLSWPAVRGRTYTIYSSDNVLGPYEVFERVTVHNDDSGIAIPKSFPLLFFLVEETP